MGVNELLSNIPLPLIVNLPYQIIGVRATVIYATNTIALLVQLQNQLQFLSEVTLVISRYAQIIDYKHQPQFYLIINIADIIY